MTLRTLTENVNVGCEYPETDLQDKKFKKPESTIEFIALTKISLEITFAVILSAIFIFLLKNFLNSGCLKFNHFQQGEGSRETIHRHSRQPVAGRPVFDIRQDKPPSYEECVSSSSREFLVEPPPPYTISGNCRMEFNRNDASIILPNFNDQRMKTLKVSEFMELEKKINS
ncbi:hypothetical protein RUM43_000672 [Polyplax serrata]|uniref:Uncharacterized protein n=1 Tax=Polyplax serrata TaxID=468196 RepID=A0AAN8SHJ0_POLSC